MNIAVISVHGCPCIPPGGMDAGGMNVYVRETSIHLGKLGHSVTVFSRHHEGGTSLTLPLARGVLLVHVPVGDVSIGKAAIAETLPEFTEVVLEWSSGRGMMFEVVAAHYWFSGLVGLSLAEAWGVPCAFSYHTMASTKLAARDDEIETDERLVAERQIADRSDRVVVWTVEESMRVRSTYNLPRSQVDVSAPGVDCARFAPVDRSGARLKLGFPDVKTALFVGRLDGFKGVGLLLEAFLEVKSGLTDARLVVAGDGDARQRGEFTATVAKQRLEESVSWVGTVPQDEMPTLYSSADILLAPSFHETYGLAVLEAAACGLPAVAANVDGLRAIVVDGETGYLVNTREAGDYAKLVLRLLFDDDLRRKMSMASRRRSKMRSWETVAMELAMIYHKMAYVAHVLPSRG